MNKNTQKIDTTPKKKRILPWLIPLIVGMIFLSLVITLFSVSKVAKIYHQVEKQELLDEVTHSLNNGKKQLVTSQGSNPFYIDIKASESGTDTIVVTLIVENDYVSFVKNDMPMIKKSIIEGMESAEGIKLTKSEHQWVKEMNFSKYGIQSISCLIQQQQFELSKKSIGKI